MKDNGSAHGSCNQSTKNNDNKSAELSKQVKLNQLSVEKIRNLVT